MSTFIRHLTFDNYKKIGSYVDMGEMKEINLSGCPLLKTLSVSIWIDGLESLHIGLSDDCSDLAEIVRVVEARWTDDPLRCFGLARRITSIACRIPPGYPRGDQVLLVSSCITQFDIC